MPVSPALVKLPNELLQMCVESLGQTDRLAIAKTCRSLYEKTLSTLYSSISLNKDNVEQGTNLVTTLIVHPERAEKIRSLEITSNFATVFPPHSKSWLPLESDQSTIDRLLSMIPTTHAQFREKENNTIDFARSLLRQEIFRLSSDSTIVAYLLIAATEVRYLKLAASASQTSRLKLFKVLANARRMLGLQEPCQQIKDADVELVGEDGEFVLGPHLTTLRLRGEEEGMIAAVDSRGISKRMQMRSMELIGTYTATQNATQMLHTAVFQSLQRLVIMDKSHSETIQYEDLVDALIHGCGKLQELVWDFQYQIPDDSPSPLSKGTLGKLKQLSTLKKLRIHHDHVYNRDDATIEKLKETKWPPSLLCLELTGMTMGCIDTNAASDLSAALANLPTRTRYLQFVFDFDVAYGSPMNGFLDPQAKTIETLVVTAHEQGRRLGVSMRAIGGPDDSRDVWYMGHNAETSL
ncbi:hypothetical protein NX059_012222 [Plenodomus lindquistii]|nr:hypothetical protein NX059_012222 [Plenodomus lindquistii]